MDNNSPILFLCIPIYNRLEYLEKMLERFLEDKDLFQKYIYLIKMKYILNINII